MLEGGCKSTKNGLAMGVTIGGDAAKSDKITHLLDNAREAIAENRSAQLDESDSIKKRKGYLETTYEKYSRLMRNSFNVSYSHLNTART